MVYIPPAALLALRHGKPLPVEEQQGSSADCNRQSGRVGWVGATLLKLTVLRTDTLAYINPVLYNANYVITRDHEYSMNLNSSLSSCCLIGIKI